MIPVCWSFGAGAKHQAWTSRLRGRGARGLRTGARMPVERTEAGSSFGVLGDEFAFGSFVGDGLAEAAARALSKITIRCGMRETAVEGAFQSRSICRLCSWEWTVA